MDHLKEINQKYLIWGFAFEFALKILGQGAL